MRWPRKNDAESIRSRREAMSLDGGLVTSVDLEPFAEAAESLVGVAVIPVSAVPVEIELGDYELSDDGDVVETGRATETVHVPLAHTEGGLTASMTRGALAAGAIRTYVLHDRITRASCFVCAERGRGGGARPVGRGELPAMRAFLESADDPSLSKRAQLRGVKTHVVGPMCHVLWQWTTGDAVGPNMMTRNSYALNMAYVMQRAPVKPERAILEANMGGDKKPSAEYFQSGHGKTVLAEAFLSDEQIRRVLRTTAEDLEALSWAGHARVGRERDAVRGVHPRLGDCRGLRGHGPGSRDGRHELDGTRHGAPRRGRAPGDDPLRRPRGRHRRRRHHPSLGTRLARLDRLRRTGPGLPLRPDRRRGGALARDQRVGRDGDRRQRELLQGAPRARRTQVIALVFRYEVRDPVAFEQVYGPEGEWAQFFRSGDGYIGTELLHDVDEPDRYLVIDRWESADAYNAFLAEHQAEYLRRSDEARFHFVQELRFGTFENIWRADPSAS